MWIPSVVPGMPVGSPEGRWWEAVTRLQFEAEVLAPHPGLRSRRMGLTPWPE